MYSAIDLVVESFSKKLRAEKKKRDDRVAALGRAAALPDSDATELNQDLVLGPRAIDCFLEYEDANGYVSSRSIAVSRVIEVKNKWFLSCFCHERREPRWFRLDRVIELIDLSTGEVVADPLNWVKEHLGHGYNERSIEVLASEVTVLLALSCSDGKVIEDELDFIKLHIDRSEIVPVHSVVFTDKALAVTSINERTLYEALRVIKHCDSEQKRKLMRSARQVVEADGILHANEVSTLEFFIKKGDLV
ncbi:terB_like domain containing protein [Caulobacteraceae bacterium]